MEHLWQTDPEIARVLVQEKNRQNDKIELIASENFVSYGVMEAQGSVLTNKYAEGYPGKRYYGGCEYVDIAENLARDRIKAIFGAEHANVQPHSGANANTAVYLAVLRPGDTVLGMNLAHGGHLTHGSPVNISGMHYNFVAYGVDENNHRIDYDAVRSQARQHRPKLLVAGASAYPRMIDFQIMGEIAAEVDALFMVDMAHIAGLVAVGLHSNPVPHADFVTSTTHKTLRGPRGGIILCKEKYAQAIDKAVFPGLQGGPLMHVIAAKAVCFKEALSPAFKTYQRQVLANARVLGEELQGQGIDLVSGGTDNHLLLLDLRFRGISGREAETRLDAIGITVNKNAIPFDPESPLVTSGIRVGTPAVTTRGFGEPEMKEIAALMAVTLSAAYEQEKDNLRAAVRQICARFPLYLDL